MQSVFPATAAEPGCPDLADAARAVSRVLASGVLPVTLEFLDQVCIGAVEDFAHIGLDTSAGALLIFGQDGDRP